MSNVAFRVPSTLEPLELARVQTEGPHHGPLSAGEMPPGEQSWPQELLVSRDEPSLATAGPNTLEVEGLLLQSLGLSFKFPEAVFQRPGPMCHARAHQGASRISWLLSLPPGGVPAYGKALKGSSLHLPQTPTGFLPLQRSFGPTGQGAAGPRHMRSGPGVVSSVWPSLTQPKHAS